MSVAKHIKEHAQLGLSNIASPFSFHDAAQKTIIAGAVPPFDVTTTTTQTVLHGNAAVIADKIWFYPFSLAHKSTYDLFNIGFGATNAGTADTLHIGIYSADTGLLVHSDSVSFTAGATSTWANAAHEVGPILPRNIWVGLVPELSTNTAAAATLEYAATLKVASMPGADINFSATGAPATVVYTDGVGRYGPTIIRPTHPTTYTFPSSIDFQSGTSASNSALAINMATELPALRISLNAVT